MNADGPIHIGRGEFLCPTIFEAMLKPKYQRSSAFISGLEIQVLHARFMVGASDPMGLLRIPSLHRQ